MSTVRISKKGLIWAVSILLLLVFIAGAFAIYLCDYYRADTETIKTFLPMSDIKEKSAEGALIFEPETVRAGLIFYPGGKVEYTAYVPLMRALADEGILCILVEMPFNLAVFDINAADGRREDYPDVTNWYIGGHSLGGSMAAAYLADNTDAFCGLVLLGSYSTEDFSGSDIKVLSIYGSEDGVMNRKKYDENKVNLPDNFTEYIIEGGSHAYFGMYGEQDGDGNAKITNAEQIYLTAAAVKTFIED